MLLDTSGLFCLHHGAEPFHAQAREVYREARVRLTHGYILAEFVALRTRAVSLAWRHSHLWPTCWITPTSRPCGWTNLCIVRRCRCY